MATVCIFEVVFLLFNSKIILIKIINFYKNNTTTIIVIDLQEKKCASLERIYLF
jgi:hypothetical protein